MTQKEIIIKGLQPLFTKARKKYLWFYCRYQGLWFHPDSLEHLQNVENRFVWGFINWELRKPGLKRRIIYLFTKRELQ